MENVEFDHGNDLNALDLVQVTVWPPSQGASNSKFALWTDLRFDKERLLIEGWDVEVHLVRAELSADLIGCRIEPGTIYGDSPLPAVEFATESETYQSEVSGSGKASASVKAGLLDGLSVSGGLNTVVGGRAHSITAGKREATIVNRRVASLPNNRWEISEPRRNRLKGTYLRAPADMASSDLEVAVAEGPLCTLGVLTYPFHARLAVGAYSQDIDADVEPTSSTAKAIWSGARKPNKYAIVKALITKACREQSTSLPESQSKPTGKVVLAGYSISGSLMAAKT